MSIEFTLQAWEDFRFWIGHDLSKVEKIHALNHSIRQEPYKGLGSPEPLRHELQGFWSGRIDLEHRLVYRVTGIRGHNQKIQIIQCRYHY